MAIKISIPDQPKITEEKGLLIWTGYLSAHVLDSIKHKIVYSDTFGKEDNPVHLKFSLPENEVFCEETRKHIDLLASKAVKLIYQERSEKGTKKVVSGKAVFNTYEYLRRVSYSSYDLAVSNFEGSNLNYACSMAFSAFTLEAYLNHAGNYLFKFWKDLEIKLSPIGKLLLIVDKINLPLDFGARPSQSFNEIFDFRQKIVHGKSKVMNFVDLEYILLEDERPPLPKSPLEKLINPKKAKIFLDDTSAMIKEIHNMIWPGDYHFDSGFNEWSARILIS